MNYIEVNLDKADTVDRFKKFYEETLLPNFDKDEIETYNQFIELLSNTKNYKKSSYHVLIILDEQEKSVGGIIFDYFSLTNTGFIEYIVTDSNYQQKKVGSFALECSVKFLNKIAKKHGFSRVDFIACEVEKPINGKQPKHYFWEKYGFKTLDFKYIQPPLDENKNAVEIMNFGIITKAPSAEFEKDNIPKELLKKILNEYYDEPESFQQQYLKEMYTELDEKLTDSIFFVK